MATDSNEADLFFSAYEENAKHSDETLQAIKRKLAAPNLRVNYLDLLNTIWNVWKIPPKDVTPDDIGQALYLLSKKHEGGIELDPVSCRVAGVDPVVLFDRIRASLTRNVGNLPASMMTPRLPPAPSEQAISPAKEDRSVAPANKEAEATGPGEAAGVKSGGSSLKDVSAQQAAQVSESKARQDSVTTGDQAGYSTQGVRRYGFRANMDRHKAIAEIVTRHAPNWRENLASWKASNVLESICADLDKAASLDESGQYEIPESWKKGGKTQALGGAKAKGWSDALQLAPKKLVIDQINASLKMVLKHDSAS